MDFNKPGYPCDVSQEREQQEQDDREQQQLHEERQGGRVEPHPEWQTMHPTELQILTGISDVFIKKSTLTRLQVRGSLANVLVKNNVETSKICNLLNVDESVNQWYWNIMHYLDEMMGLKK